MTPNCDNVPQAPVIDYPPPLELQKQHTSKSKITCLSRLLTFSFQRQARASRIKYERNSISESFPMQLFANVLVMIVGARVRRRLDPPVFARVSCVFLQSQPIFC